MKKFLAIGLFGVLALILVATVIFNRAQPSGEDRSVGIALAASGKRAISSDGQQVLWAATRDHVLINAYGFADAATQEKLLVELRSQLEKERYRGTVTVSFFPPREYTLEERDGRRISTLKKANATRHVVLVEAK